MKEERNNMPRQSDKGISYSIIETNFMKIVEGLSCGCECSSSSSGFALFKSGVGSS